MVLKKKRLRKYLLILVFFAILILSFNVSTAESYYADIQISVDNAGLVDIKGLSNHPDLLVENSDMYTSKKQSYWLVNITKNDTFEDYIYTLTLPKGALINHIKASGFRGIEEENGQLIVSGTGENEELSVVVQYQINQTSELYNFSDYAIIIFLLISILALTVLLIYFLNKNKKAPSYKKDSKSEYSFKGLSERQKEIVKLLINTKRPLTQTEIKNELEMPKAAVSRNVHSLEIKGIVEIEQSGMSNLVRLKK